MNAKSASPVIAATLNLSPREAALAEAVSKGRSIVEAGAELKLTQETARNYSKRIYAKTGARGQADLVRILLTGLLPFA
jgi:DNA-binding CsgD family transcriptional regulator